MTYIINFLGTILILALLLTAIIGFFATNYYNFKEEKETTRKQEISEELCKFEAARDARTTHFKHSELIIEQSNADQYFKTDGSSGHKRINIIRLDNGSVHFWEGSRFTNHISPDFILTAIDYNPHYTEHTISTTNGKSGSALIGGIVAGPTGAVIGASGKRVTTSNTTYTEQSSWGIITLECINHGSYYQNQFRLIVQMNEEVYQDLAVNYLVTNSRRVEM